MIPLRTSLTAQDLVVLAALNGAANAGSSCPSNEDIMAMTNVASPASAAAILKKLQKRGLITVERIARARRVTIVETGRQTAAVTGRPRSKGAGPNHRTAMAVYSARKQAERIRAEEADKLVALAIASVEREPCFRCGVRGDVGCKHRPSRSGLRSAAGSPAAVLAPAAAGACVSLSHG